MFCLVGRLSGMGSPLVEWAVPQASRLKYTQLFNTTDRTRSGYLSGVQARNILLASQQPQAILAKIWSLADMDCDGRLSCEEFVLALHLCDMARRGEPIPSTLPPNLLPPTLRRNRNNSLSQLDDPFSGVTFEDKRKENFEKGQAELERRRKTLLEQQRKEQEERERKEREEAERQERVRLDQERKRQEELERQAERQREAERLREEERRRAQQQRDAARREMERQRQEEWEKQRIQELQTQRQKQQDSVLALKAKNQTLTIELSQLNEKASELSKKISETRCKVTSVKGTIDGMRSTRDEQMANQTRLKHLLKGYNQRLVAASQAKARQESGRVAEDQAAASTKQLNIRNLKEKNSHLEEAIKNKTADVENNNVQVDNLKKELAAIIADCEQLYSQYDLKRNKVLELKGNSRSSGWGEEAWDAAPSQWPAATDTTPPDSGGVKFRALYEFTARNSDELSFQPGDIILVVPGEGEPGWLSGELRGDRGWFPESYVEPLSQSAAPQQIQDVQPKTPLEGIVEVSEGDEGPPLPPYPEPRLGGGQPCALTAVANYLFLPIFPSQLPFSKGDLITISETQDQWLYGTVGGASGWLPRSYVSLEEAPVPMVPATPPLPGQEYYVASYAYQSEEAGDLTFEQGEVIVVTGREGDWWTGTVGGRTGIFPSNYVQPAPQEAVQPVQTSPPQQVEAPPQPVPATVDKEVEQKSTPVTLEAQSTGGSSRAVTPDVSSTSGTPQPDTGSGEESETKGKGKKPEIATVIAPYQGSSPEQLSLSRGQLIMIRKKTSTGWWEGELQAKGKKRQIGWFPASYVKLLGGGTSSSQAKSPSPLTNKESGTDTNTERVVALYQYEAQNEDELSFEKDDVILVIAREEPAWWKGELNGVTGLFPSNYVGPL